MKSKPRRSPKGRAKTKHGAVRKKKNVDLHPKPHECRQQIVDAFSKKMPRLPPGEMGFLLVLPADRRGPARIEHRNMTSSQVVATVQGLCSSLPSQMPHHKQRLDNWVSHLKAQRKRQRTSKRRKRPERSSSSTDGSEGECRDSDAADQGAAGSEGEACSSEDSQASEEAIESSEDSQGREDHSKDSKDPTSSEEGEEEEEEEEEGMEADANTDRDRDCDEAVWEATEAVLLLMPVHEFETLSTKDLKKSVLQKVAAELRRDPNTIKADVDYTINEYKAVWQAGQGGDPDAEKAGATEGGWDKAVREATFGVLRSMSEQDFETMSGKAVRKSVAAQLQCEAEQIKTDVKHAIDEFMKRRKLPGGQKRGADAEAGTASGRGSAPVAPLEKQRPARAAANRAAAVLVQLRESNAGSPQASTPGKGKPSKAPAAAVEKLQPVGDLQVAAAQATKVKDVVDLYVQLAKDVASGKVGLQQARSDLSFAAEAADVVGGIWVGKTAEAAVKKALVAVNVRQLQLDTQRAGR